MRNFKQVNFNRKQLELISYAMWLLPYLFALLQDLPTVTAYQQGYLQSRIMLYGILQQCSACIILTFSEQPLTLQVMLLSLVSILGLCKVFLLWVNRGTIGWLSPDRGWNDQQVFPLLTPHVLLDIILNNNSKVISASLQQIVLFNCSKLDKCVLFIAYYQRKSKRERYNNKLMQ